MEVISINYHLIIKRTDFKILVLKIRSCSWGRGTYIVLLCQEACSDVCQILLWQLQMWQNRRGMWATWRNSQIYIYLQFQPDLMVNPVCMICNWTKPYSALSSEWEEWSFFRLECSMKGTLGSESHSSCDNVAILA